MPRPARDDGLDKFQRFRTNRNGGMKLVRIWVPDPNSPEFAAAARREADVLRGATEEQRDARRGPSGLLSCKGVVRCARYPI